MNSGSRIHSTQIGHRRGHPAAACQADRTDPVPTSAAASAETRRFTPIHNHLRHHQAIGMQMATAGTSVSTFEWQRLGGIDQCRKEKGPMSCSSLTLHPLHGAPGEIRTPDHQVRSLVLYPAELRAHGTSFRGKPCVAQLARFNEGADYSLRRRFRQHPSATIFGLARKSAPIRAENPSLPASSAPARCFLIRSSSADAHRARGCDPGSGSRARRRFPFAGARFQGW